MKNNYKIKVQVTIEACSEAITASLSQKDDGQCEWIISAEEAHQIDSCEQILLQTNYAAMRAALVQHLSTVSQQYALAEGGTLATCQVKPYRVEGEVGRLTFANYWLPAPEGGDQPRCPFPALHASEWYRTTGFKEIALIRGVCQKSYRQTSADLNRARHQPQATPSRTLRQGSEREGSQLLAYVEQRAGAILVAHAFSEQGQPLAQAEAYSQQVLDTWPAAEIEAARQQCAPDETWLNEMAGNPVPYENPASSTTIALDDVGVKRQKSQRQQKEKEKAVAEAERVYNTIAHIAHAGQTYVLNGVGVTAVLRVVLAFLLHNQRLQDNLIFFVDGQRSLYTTILDKFAWLPTFQIILDWFHLEKRCQEQLSLALKGRDIRNALLEKLCPCLWQGCVDRAIALLRAVEATHIKNEAALTTLIAYLERNRPYLPCYSVRKRLGLCNSSNRGEKANDLLVSIRQKHNGMSWSKSGSAALAALTALARNHEANQWFQSQTLAFSFSSP